MEAGRSAARGDAVALSALAARRAQGTAPRRADNHRIVPGRTLRADERGRQLGAYPVGAVKGLEIILTRSGGVGGSTTTASRRWRRRVRTETGGADPPRREGTEIGAADPLRREGPEVTSLRSVGCRPTPSGGPRNHLTEIGGADPLCREGPEITSPRSGRVPTPSVGRAPGITSPRSGGADGRGPNGIVPGPPRARLAGIDALDVTTSRMSGQKMRLCRKPFADDAGALFAVIPYNPISSEVLARHPLRRLHCTYSGPRFPRTDDTERASKATSSLKPRAAFC